MWTTLIPPTTGKTAIDRTAFIRKLEQRMQEIVQQMEELEREISARRVQVRFGTAASVAPARELAAA